MNFDYSEKVKGLQRRLGAFMDEYIYPNERQVLGELEAGGPWQFSPLIEQLKQKARDAGLWNLFLPESALGAGLTNLEYAPLCEMMGRVPFSAEVFNCSAPDTGNMEVLSRYGTEEQKAPYSARNLPYPKITCRGAVRRAQRHVPNSISTLRWIIAQTLANSHQ